MSVSFLKREGAPDLAYRIIEGHNKNLPTVLFLPGFRSDMGGTKAQFLAQECPRNGQRLVLFDYRAHGQSGGAFEDGTIGLWRDDALDIIDFVTNGPLVLVGSSMGGWIGLLAAIARPDRVKGYIGIAAAPDFTRVVKSHMNERQRADLAQNGYFLLPNVYTESPHMITKKLLDDAEHHCLLDGEIAIDAPVRLINGMKDDEVPWQTAPRILNALRSQDKKAYMREEGNHSLSAPDDLALLAKLIGELSGS